MKRRTVLLAPSGLALGLVASGLARPALAQARPVRIVVPFAAGGSTDLLTRILAQAMSAATGQPFVVDNRSGAGGNIAAEIVARAAPDGLTMLMCTPGILSINRHLYRTLPFSPDTDFATVGLVAELPNMVAARNGLGIAGLAELTEAGRRQGQLRYASPGVGTTGHLTSELLGARLGLPLVHVPYRGSAPTAEAVLKGEVDFAIDNLPPFIPHHRAGGLRALAVTSPERWFQVPDVLSIVEAGFPDLAVMVWFGLVAPARTPPETVRRLEAAVASAIADPEVKTRFAAVGVAPRPGKGSELSALAAEESRRWQAVILRGRISVE